MREEALKELKKYSSIWRKTFNSSFYWNSIKYWIYFLSLYLTDSKPITDVSQKYGTKIIFRQSYLTKVESPKILSWKHRVFELKDKLGPFFISLPAIPLYEILKILKMLLNLIKIITVIFFRDTSRKKESIFKFG